MITPEEFRTRWGEEEFVHFPPDIVNRLNIPEDARQFLLQVGLPKQAEPMFVFDVAQNTLPALPEYLPSYNFPPEYTRYRLIGQKQIQWADGINITHFICLDEQADGQVVWVLNRADYPASFLNTSLLHLAEMLWIYHEYRQWVYYSETPWEIIYSSGEWDQRSHDTASALKKVDPMTYAHETVWFWTIFETESECSPIAEASDLLEENQSRTVFQRSAFPLEGIDYDIPDIDEADPFTDNEE